MEISKGKGEGEKEKFNKRKNVTNTLDSGESKLN